MRFESLLMHFSKILFEVLLTLVRLVMIELCIETSAIGMCSVLDQHELIADEFIKIHLVFRRVKFPSTVYANTVLWTFAF